MSVDRARKDAAEALARRFHETYERLAPKYGYVTRSESSVPWEDVPEKNKRLMIAVAAEVGDVLVSELEAAQKERDEAFLIADEQTRLRTRGLEAALRYCMNAYCGADDLDGVVMIEDRPLDNYITEMLTPKGTA